MIVNLIQQIATDMNLGFYHGRDDFMNLQGDEDNFPALYLDMPITTNYNLVQSGHIVESNPISILVLYKSELDWTIEQHQTVIDLANNNVREIITRINTSDSVDSVDSITSLDVINLFDVNVSGKSLDLTITLRNNEGICL